MQPWWRRGGSNYSSAATLCSWFPSLLLLAVMLRCYKVILFDTIASTTVIIWFCVLAALLMSLFRAVLEFPDRSRYSQMIWQDLEELFSQPKWKQKMTSKSSISHNSLFFTTYTFTIPPLLRLLRHTALLSACCNNVLLIRPTHSLKMSSSVLQVKFLSENAKMPTRGSPQSAGFDLSAAEAKVVPAGGRAVVKTDLSIACPEGTYARIAPRRWDRYEFIFFEVLSFFDVTCNMYYACHCCSHLYITTLLTDHLSIIITTADLPSRKWLTAVPAW